MKSLPYNYVSMGIVARGHRQRHGLDVVGNVEFLSGILIYPGQNLSQPAPMDHDTWLGWRCEGGFRTMWPTFLGNCLRSSADNENENIQIIRRSWPFNHNFSNGSILTCLKTSDRRTSLPNAPSISVRMAAICFKTLNVSLIYTVIWYIYLTDYCIELHLNAFAMQYLPLQ